jgi:hypothetical protein
MIINILDLLFVLEKLSSVLRSSLGYLILMNKIIIKLIHKMDKMRGDSREELI